ncbi:MAG: hypothetical protein Hals2KO_12450 [Halioglobus sp.]
MTEQAQSVVIEASHPCFPGHFPDNPLLPGALLLLRIQHLVERHTPPWRLVEVKSAKFLAPVRPGDTLDVRWQTEELQEQLRLRLRAFVEGRQVCQATLLLERTL